MTDLVVSFDPLEFEFSVLALQVGLFLRNLFQAILEPFESRFGRLISSKHVQNLWICGRGAGRSAGLSPTQAAPAARPRGRLRRLFVKQARIVPSGAEGWGWTPLEVHRIEVKAPVEPPVGRPDVTEFVQQIVIKRIAIARNIERDPVLVG